MNDSEIVKTFAGYRKRIEFYLRNLVHSQDIDDIVQETFVRSFEAELNHDIKYARSFMLKTARNIALNHIEKWDNKYSSHLDELSESSIDTTSLSPENDAQNREKFLVFCEAVDQLSGNVRKAFILKKVYGQSQKEIAKNLNISESTVEKHVAKGIRHCSDYLLSKTEATEKPWSNVKSI